MKAFQKIFSKLCLYLLGTVFLINNTNGQTTRLTLDLAKPGAAVSPMLYGLMTEEINHSYDGGLYAELIRNRIFKDNPIPPEVWGLVRQVSGSNAAIKLLPT